MIKISMGKFVIEPITVVLLAILFLTGSYLQQDSHVNVMLLIQN